MDLNSSFGPSYPCDFFHFGPCVCDSGINSACLARGGRPDEAMAVSHEKATAIGTMIPVSFLSPPKAAVYRLHRRCGWRWKCGQTTNNPPRFPPRMTCS